MIHALDKYTMENALLHKFLLFMFFVFGRQREREVEYMHCSVSTIHSCHMPIEEEGNVKCSIFTFTCPCCLFSGEKGREEFVHWRERERGTVYLLSSHPS